jgi:hypothetical protein
MPLSSYTIKITNVNASLINVMKQNISGGTDILSDDQEMSLCLGSLIVHYPCSVSSTDLLPRP